MQRVYRRIYDTLPGDINEPDPDFIVTLHCNTFNEKALGTEVLYYHRSQKGREMADILHVNLVNVLGLKDQGTKLKSAEGCDGYLLKTANAPCFIAEPFFIDNNEDLKAAIDNRQAMVDAYAFAIKVNAEMVV